MIAQKGGAGKTTLSIHLAVRAGLEGLRVLLVDTDPQASATAWWRRRREETPALIQCGNDLLADTLTTAGRQRYDVVVVDTAPHSSEEAIATARLSDLVVIPTRPAILDLDAIAVSTELVLATKTQAQIVLNGCPPPTRYGEPHIVSEAREALKSYGIPVSTVALSQRAAFSHALIDGKSVNEFEGNGKAAREIDNLWSTLRREMAL
jgi:chromosome partitioning protein